MDDTVTKEIHELGPLGAILAQEDVEDIYVLGPHQVIVGRSDGGRERVEVDFGSAEALQHLIGRVLEREGKQLSQALPFADGRLADGSRLHVATAPSADPWPQLVIRRHRHLFSDGQDRLEALIRLGTITPQLALLLRYAIRAGASILVAGATAAGKSTFISALGSEMDPLCPVVCIEDTRELDFPGLNISSLVAIPATSAGEHTISQRFLVHQALRKSPRWIVLGEARGAEAWDFAQAGNTGHGILASVHANSARDAVERYKDICMEAGENMEERVVLRSVLRAFRIIVYIERCPRSKRRVVRHVVDLTSNITEGNIPVLQDLFVFEDGQLRCTKCRPYPRLTSLLEEAGLDYMDIVQGRKIPQAWFAAEPTS